MTRSQWNALSVAFVMAIGTGCVLAVILWTEGRPEVWHAFAAIGVAALSGVGARVYQKRNGK